MSRPAAVRCKALSSDLAVPEHLRCLLALAIVAVWAALHTASALGATYEVGPGKTYANIGDVAWESLVAGDTVNIHWRATPYKEKWVICRQGTAMAPITVHGVPDADGNLPVISGDGATTRTQLNFWGEERSILKIGGANTPADTIPSYIIIENLDIRTGRPGYSFTGRNGLTNYVSNAAPIYVEKCDHVTIRNCILSDSGNGMMLASSVTSALIEGCYLHDNGIEGSVYEHQSYNESVGVTYQYNHYGAMRLNCGGNELKDRSAGLVIRYNWIEGGNRNLDLVETDHDNVLAAADYHKTFVYGNVLIKPQSNQNNQIIHYGGDGADQSYYRKGKLYLYNNTIISTRTGNTVLCRLSTSEETADIRNNIIYVTAAGSSLALLTADGAASLTHNWLKAGYRSSFEAPFNGTVTDDGTSVTGASPGFVNEAGQDYRLAAASACVNAGAALHADTLSANSVTRQYVKHQLGEDRPTNGALDIGAYEYAPPAALSIATASLPAGTVGAAYSRTLSASGGTAPYTWSVSAGNLPDGLSLGAASGVVSGMPSADGTFAFTARAVDSQGTPATATKALSIAIAADPATDSDGDGLPDAWETTHFGNLGQNGAGDPDADGYSNWAEYVMSTVPSTTETQPPYFSTAAWAPTGLSGGGAEYNPTPAPNNPQLMFASCDMGGFYKSTDGGRHWRMINGTLVNGVPGYRDDDCGPEINPQNENIMLVSRSIGLARTTDAGETFTKVSSVQPTAIAFHATSPSLAFMSGPVGDPVVYRLYRSTDTGATWTEVPGWASGVGAKIRELFVDPTTAAGSATLYVSTAQGVYRSTNGGANWSARNTGLGSTDIIDMKYGMKGAQLILYATTGGTVYKTTDGGGTWTAVMTGLPTSFSDGPTTYPIFYGTIGVCATNADVAYAGSDELWGPTIYKTADGGAHWTLKLIHPNASNFPATSSVERDWQTIHLGWGWQGDPHQLNVCQTDPDVVAFTDDGDCLRSDDGGDHWFSCDSDETSVGSDWWRTTGYGVTTCYLYTVDPRQPNRHYISYTDIGFARSIDSGATWVHSPNGSPWRNTFYEIACDPTVDGVIWAAATNKHDLPQWSAIQTPLTDPIMVGGIVKSTDWGAHWTDMGHSTGLPTGAATSIVVDPTSPSGSRTLYCVIFAKGVYKSTDGGANWTQKVNGLSMPSNTNYWKIQRASDGTLYCAITHRIETVAGVRHYYKGGLFRSTDGANTWTLVNTNQDLIWIANFSIDPNDPNKIYVGCINAAGGLAGGGGYKTADGGATWTKMFDYGDTWNIVPDPERPNRLLAGVLAEGSYEGNGIFMSDDGGATWWRSPTFPFTMIGGYQATYDPADSQNVYFTTYGGSVFKARLLHPTAPHAAFTSDKTGGQAPLDVAFDASTSTGDIEAYTWDFGDGGVSHSAAPTHTFTAAGSFTVTLTVEGTTGTDTATATIAVDPEGGPDTDGDGLPDGWETDFFGGTGQGGGGDPDGDGLTNLEEYTQGTDPTQEDSAAPTVASLASVPTSVRENLDNQIAVTGTATDVATGNSRIVGAEYFIDTAGSAGTGTPMNAADGEFSSPVESLTATIDTSSWHGDHTIKVHARDALGHWSAYADLDVSVVDGAAPAAVSDLAITPVALFDAIQSQPWATVGSVLPDPETLTIDLGSSRSVGAVSLTPQGLPASFPKTLTISASADGVDWTVLAREIDYKAVAGKNLWETASGSYRYVRITATPVRDRVDRHFYVRMSDATVYEETDDNHMRATWTATADNGSDASSGPAAAYDMRFAPATITQASFNTLAQGTPMPAPGAGGHAEEATFSVGAMTGTIYAALKIGDDVPNWSTMSNVASAQVTSRGLRSVHPEDLSTVEPASAVQFAFTRGQEITKASVAFSDRPDFPSRAIANPNGTTSRTIRYALKNGVSYWKPTPAQWIAIKRLASNGRGVYWRLEGTSASYPKVTGPSRAMLFATGDVTALAVTPSHAAGADEAVWPDRDAIPSFTWTKATTGMKYFYVDVSTDDGMPLKDSRRTAIIGAGKIAGASYQPLATEWLKVRKLAGANGGFVYWRVRAQDQDKALTYVSAMKKLVIDGGTWTTSDVDLSSTSPQVSWTHDGAGIVNYFVQFSADGTFEPLAKTMARVPFGTLAAPPCTLSAADVKRIQALAARNSVTMLHYRVAGQDADKAFATYSAEKTCVVP